MIFGVNVLLVRSCKFQGGILSSIIADGVVFNLRRQVRAGCSSFVYDS